MKILISCLFIAILSGCATIPDPVVESTITTFYSAKYKKTGSISVVATTTEVNDSLEFSHYKDRIEKKLASHGYRIEKNPSEAEYIALVAYGIDNGKSGIVTTPIFGTTGGGATFTSYGTSSYTMPSYGTVGASTQTVTSYTRAIALDIVNAVDTKSGQPKKLFEIRARSVGTCSVIAGVFNEILESMFQDFPGENGKAKKIAIKYNGTC